MTRPIRSAAAASLAAVLTFLSPGLPCYQAWAQALEATGGSYSIPVVPGAIPAPGALPSGMVLPQSISLTVPRAAGMSFSLPAVPGAIPAPGALPESPSQGVARELSGMQEALGPEIQALERAGALDDDEGSAGAADGAFRVLIGQPGFNPEGFSAYTWPDEDEEGASLESFGGLGRYGAQPESAPDDAPPVPASVEKRGWAERLPYGVKRRMLAAVAALSGVAYSLPVADDAAQAYALERASRARFVFMDIDDTLTRHNQKLGPNIVQAVQDVLRAGKTPAFITDRPDFGKGESAFESLSALPVETRVGLFVGTNAGGRVYQYNDQGEPKLVYEKPAMDEALKGRIVKAAEALKARLSTLGVVQHDGSQGIPLEALKPHSYGIMLAVGTPAKGVLAVARELRKEMLARGVDYEVVPRMAKDPSKPPYVIMNLVDKSAAAGEIAGRLGATAQDTVILGDSMFMPRPSLRGGAPGFLERLARRLSGQAMPETGNETDRNIEKALPGALTMAVGRTADPRMRNAFVLPGLWDVETPRVLAKIASRPPADLRLGELLRAAGLFILAAGAIVGVIFLDAWLLYKLFEGVLAAPMSGDPDLPPGMHPLDWRDLFSALPAMGLAALGSFLVPRDVLPNPAELYARALKEASEAASSRDWDPEQVLFYKATASMDVRSGKHWTFWFHRADPARPEAVDVITVDFKRLPASSSGGFWSDKSIHLSVPARVALFEGRSTLRMPVAFARGAQLSPERALEEARRGGFPGQGGTAVELYVDQDAQTGDKSMWYAFHDDSSHAVVSSENGAVKSVVGPQEEPPRPPAGPGDFERFWGSWWGPPLFFAGLMSWLVLAGAALAPTLSAAALLQASGLALALMGALFFILAGGNGGLPRGFFLGGILTAFLGQLMRALSGV